MSHLPIISNVLSLQDCQYLSVMIKKHLEELKANTADGHIASFDMDILNPYLQELLNKISNCQNKISTSLQEKTAQPINKVNIEKCFENDVNYIEYKKKELAAKKEQKIRAKKRSHVTLIKDENGSFIHDETPLDYKEINKRITNPDEFFEKLAGDKRTEKTLPRYQAIIKIMKMSHDWLTIKELGEYLKNEKAFVQDGFNLEDKNCFSKLYSLLDRLIVVDLIQQRPRINDRSVEYKYCGTTDSPPPETTQPKDSFTSIDTELTSIFPDKVTPTNAPQNGLEKI